MKQHIRRISAFLLVLALLATLAAPALAAEGDEIHIRTAQDLVALSRNCSMDSWSAGKTVYLEADIDLGGSGFQPIPIFCGTFDGQGHAITGFSLSGSGNDRGFFRYVQAGATVQDLNVQGAVTPSDRKDSIGGLVGVNCGKLLNCTFQGNVKAGSNVGGIAGCNKATGQLINCSYSGILLGEHYVGGIVGLNEGSVIRCQNNGDVNIAEVKTAVAIQDVDLSAIRSTETIPASTDIGGIAGASSGILQSCTNRGDVGYEHVGYNVGGIAGRQSGWLDSCVNSGTVKGRKDVGGICGQMEPRLTLLFDADSLDDLCDELDALQALMDQAISDADGVSDSISAQMNGITDSADKVKSAASGLSDALTDWAEENMETVNDASARISWTLDRLEPVASSVDAALDRIQASADLAEDALDEMAQMGGLAEDALAALRLALDRVRSSAGLASDAVDRLEGAVEYVQDALGDSGAMSAAMEEVQDALYDLMAVFGAMFDALDDLWTAVGNLYRQNSGASDSSPEPEPGGESPGETETDAPPAGEDGADAGDATELPDAGVPTWDGNWDGLDWTEASNAIREMSTAAAQIQSALGALRRALDGVADTAERVPRDTLSEIAHAADTLDTAFQTLDEAAGHMEDALDGLDDAAVYGESASDLLKESAEALGDACGQLREAGSTFSHVMSELADQPEISFRPAGEAVTEMGDVLDETMAGLSDAMQSLNDTMSASSDLLLADLRAINNQFGKVIDVLRRHTDSEEEEDDEGLLEDVSDQATETDEDAGRITNARNTGAVEGDVNVAGIVGSMAIEYDYDPEDDLTNSGDRSLNFRYQAAALTESCVSTGDITAKKDYVGGIVGRMDLGTVSQCESYAPVESSGGDYVGGIAGAAWATIRGCWSRCALSGTDYIGGIAGLGKTVSGCRALVEIDGGAAYLGAVLGDVEEDGEVSGNLFTHETLGGIDGVSYQGQAEPVDFETLSQSAPHAFTRFRLTFTADGQVVETFDFSYGDGLAQLPDIPEKEGYSASWPRLDYDCLTFSRTLEAEYTPYTTALTALGDPPQIVAEGTFTSESTLSAICAEGGWSDSHGVAHTGTIYTVTVSDPARAVAGFQVQYRLSGSGGDVWLQTADGWSRVEAEADGTYLVFPVEGDSVTFTVQERSGGPGAQVLVLCGAIAAAAAVAAIPVLKRRHGETRRPKADGTAGPCP